MTEKEHKRIHAPYRPVQLLERHSDACWCVAANKPEWVLPRCARPDEVQRDLTGRRNPRAQHNWIVFTCNGAPCGARLAMYEPHFESLLGLDNPKYLQEPQ